jgi:excisionase family DNA binding protein
MQEQKPRLLNVISAAEYLSISRSKLYQWMKAGKIKFYHIDRRTVLDIRDLDEFIENLKNSN